MSALETVDDPVALGSQALADAIELQAATAEILRIISRSPADAQPVFDTIAAAALKLCAARSVNVLTYDGALLHIAALATGWRRKPSCCACCRSASSSAWAAAARCGSTCA